MQQFPGGISWAGKRQIKKSVGISKKQKLLSAIVTQY